MFFDDDTVFHYFPKTSDHFAKIYEDFSKLFRRPDESFRTFSDDYRRWPKTTEEDPKMFRSYTNEFQCSLRDKREMSSNMISSHVRISYLHVRIYRFYQFVTTRYTTDFYIMNIFFLVFSFVYSLRLFKLKTEGQTIYRKLTAKLPNSYQNSRLSWVSLVEL